MEEKVHKRRVRYAGRYPKKFEEKYKEHDPEKYADTVAHVIEKGSTPAGMHISIMVKEILDFLEIRPGQQGLDCTLGYGGHSRKMLEKLPRGALVIDLASLPGGTDFDGKNAANKDLFGGGSGAGVNIQPVAFLVVKDGCVRTIQLSDGNNTVDRALTMIPELVEKVSALIKKDEPAAPKSGQ